jgi:hypothetical protein
MAGISKQFVMGKGSRHRAAPFFTVVYPKQFAIDFISLITQQLRSLEE